ncbi:MAG: hypothetical protein ACRCUY_06905 [Thermoguttaceae bacterium]
MKSRFQSPETRRVSGTNPVGFRRGINAGAHSPARKTLFSITSVVTFWRLILALKKFKEFISNMDAVILQIHCPNCGSKLNAKSELIGQTRSCPKCKSPVLIQQKTPAITELPITSAFSQQSDAGKVPIRLMPPHRYFVLAPTRLVALWENGKGWLVNVGNGFASAKKNVDAIPDQGTFRFVEIRMNPTGGVPISLQVFAITIRGGLTALYRDENEILRKLGGSAELSLPQKQILLQYLRIHLMADVLGQSNDFLESLTT